MSHLLTKIFARVAALVLLILLGAYALVPAESFSRTTLLALVGVSLFSVYVLARGLARMLLAPFEELETFSSEVAGAQRERRLHWAFGDERDRTAIAVNRLADQLWRDIDEAQHEAQTLAAVMAGIAEGVILVDQSQRVTLVNQGFRELFGIWGDIEGRSVLEVLRIPEIHDVLQAAQIETLRDPVIRDIQIRTQTDRTLLVHAARFPEEGPSAGTLVVFHDVSELRRVDQMRRDFVANASHELRTPLTSIQGFAETLAAGGLDEDTVDRCTETILRNVIRMRNLIDDLMDISKIENREDNAERTVVDIAHLSQELVADQKKRLESAGLTAESRPGSHANAWCNQNAVTQVLENLLTNAIRYTDTGGHITISIEPATDHLKICVADTGIGIPKDALDRIFERFYRVDAARSRAVGSTGLGLSIVKHLVQAMSGTITVESEEAVGSCFTLTLPLPLHDPLQPNSA